MLLALWLMCLYVCRCRVILFRLCGVLVTLTVLRCRILRLSVFLRLSTWRVGLRLLRLLIIVFVLFDSVVRRFRYRSRSVRWR